MKNTGNGKKKILVALGTAAATLLCAGLAFGYVKLRGIWIGQCRITDVSRQVSVEGNQYISRGTVLDLMGLKNGENLATIDFGEKRREALKRAPIMKSVTIQRRLPDRLEISIEERTPVARMNVRGNKTVTGRVVDSEGVVFVRQPNTSALPFIYEERSKATAGGKTLGAMSMAALRLIQVSARQKYSSLGIISVDATKPDFLVAVLSDYSRAKFAWEGMSDGGDSGAAALEKQYDRLFKAVKSGIARHSSGGASPIVWNATRPDCIYADTKEPIQ